MASPMLTAVLLMFTRFWVSSMQQPPTDIQTNASHSLSTEELSEKEAISNSIVQGDAVLHLEENFKGPFHPGDVSPRAKRIFWNNQIDQGTQNQLLTEQKYLTDLQRSQSSQQEEAKRTSGNYQIAQDALSQSLARQKYLTDIHNQLQKQESLRYQHLIPEVKQSLPVKTTYSTTIPSISQRQILKQGVSPIWSAHKISQVDLQRVRHTQAKRTFGNNQIDQGTQNQLLAQQKYLTDLQRSQSSQQEAMYEIFTTFKLNYYESQNYCHSKDMDLAAIQTAEDQQIFEAVVKKTGLGGVDIWTSGNDLGQTGRFVWGSTGHPLTYTNWIRDNPNNYIDDGTGKMEMQHCVRMETNKNFKWNDWWCSHKAYAACQIRRHNCHLKKNIINL